MVWIKMQDKPVHLLRTCLTEKQSVLSGQGKGKLPHLSEAFNAEENVTVCDVLESKHLSVALIYPEFLETNSDSSLVYHPAILRPWMAL